MNLMGLLVGCCWSLMVFPVNIKGGGGRPIGPYNELKNLHFGNEEDMHMSSKIHEANGYGHDWELAIIL